MLQKIAKWPPDDQLTNQQLRSQRVKFLETAGEDVSSISRPRTAPVSRKFSRLSLKHSAAVGAMRGCGSGAQAEIRVIVKSKERGKPEGMIEALLKRTEKEVDVRRVEYDASCEEVLQKEKEYDALCMEMKDLISEGEALGVFKFKEAHRLEPIKSVSYKPIFSKYSHFDRLEKVLLDKKELLSKRSRMTHVLKALKARKSAELVALHQANAKKQQLVNQVATELANRRKVELQYLDLRAERTAELKALQQDFDEEVDMWNLEIKAKETFLEQKVKVERFYETSKKVEKNIQPSAHKDPVEATTRKIQASKAVWHLKQEKAVRQRKHIVLEEATNKDKYAAAFAEIGVKLRESNPAAAYSLYMSQQNIQQELDRKLSHYESELDTLRSSLDAIRSEIKLTSVASGETTTYRAIAREEKELNVKEKELSKERSEISYLQSMIRPVKLGLIELSHKLGHPISSAVSSPAELLLTEMYDRLETAINALPENSDLRQSRRNGMLGADLWTNSPRSTSRPPSKNNVRVNPPMLTPRSSRPLQMLPTKQEQLKSFGSVRSVSSSLSHSKLTATAAESGSGSGSDNESGESDSVVEDSAVVDDPETDRLRTALETTVMSREELKQASEQLTKTAAATGKLSIEDKRERLARKSIRMRSQRMRKLQVRPCLHPSKTKMMDGDAPKTKPKTSSKKKLGKSSRSMNARSVRILD